MDALSKPRVVAVGGPTATGKTALSVALAKEFGGEIINADSMQVYKNLNVTPKTVCRWWWEARDCISRAF